MPQCTAPRHPDGADGWTTIQLLDDTAAIAGGEHGHCMLRLVLMSRLTASAGPLEHPPVVWKARISASHV